MRKLISFLFVTVLPVWAFAATTSVKLSEALKNQIVKMEARSSNGHYMGKGAILTITNLSSNKLEVTVDLGIILKPYVPSIQPLVLAGTETITLKAREKGELEVYVFCGDAPKACPIKDLTYTYLKTGSDTLIKVLEFINRNAIYDYLGQCAVWAVTNKDHSLMGIYDKDRDQLSRELIGITSAATGKPQPAYYAINEKNETSAQPAYQPKTAKLFVPLDFTLSASAVVSVGVYDKAGHLLHYIIERKLMQPGKQSLMQEISAEGMERGKFIIRVTDPERTLAEKEVEIK